MPHLHTHTRTHCLSSTASLGWRAAAPAPGTAGSRPTGCTAAARTPSRPGGARTPTRRSRPASPRRADRAVRVSIETEMSFAVRRHARRPGRGAAASGAPRRAARQARRGAGGRGASGHATSRCGLHALPHSGARADPVAQAADRLGQNPFAVADDGTTSMVTNRPLHRAARAPCRPRATESASAHTVPVVRRTGCRGDRRSVAAAGMAVLAQTGM